jgi:BolA protein
MSRDERIRAALREVLEPTLLEIDDQSYLHAGHSGARDGRGHFRVRIVARAFMGKELLERHRMVYRAMGSLMSTDVHALSIEALTPEEAA